MNRQKFLSELEKELNLRNIDEVDEILADYTEHFEYKKADGYSELEICARLAPPSSIAAQYSEGGAAEKRLFPMNIVGLCCLGIFAFISFVFLFSWVLVLGASSLAFLVLSSALIFDFNISGLIPPMPYFGSMVLGISMLALAVLAFAATIYCCLYFVKLLKIYIKWNGLAANGVKIKNSPPVVVHTVTNKRFYRRLRRITQAALIAFAIAFLSGFIVLVLKTRSFEFWHKLGWFVR